MYTFKINVLIKFLAPYTRFEHHVYIIGKAIGTCSFLCYVFRSEIITKLHKIYKYKMLRS